MKAFGVVLVVVGLLSLTYAGLSRNRPRAGRGLDQLDVASTEQQTIPLSPVAGAIGVVGGILLIVTPRRRLDSV